MRCKDDETLRRMAELLLAERPDGGGVRIPAEDEALFRLWRGLVNQRPPLPAGEEYLGLEDAYLQGLSARRGVADGAALPAPVALWQGDITTLRADAIVNAANDALLGCFLPGHHCIDNAIHTFAGVRLRLACNELMEHQGHPEPTGAAKITPGFNLPARHVLHTVGPIIEGAPDGRQRGQLAACYRACLRLAAENGLSSVAFCCISTGAFHFPNRLAAEIAVRTVREELARMQGGMQVIFNVFSNLDRDIYAELLATAE